VRQGQEPQSKTKSEICSIAEGEECRM